MESGLVNLKAEVHRKRQELSKFGTQPNGYYKATNFNKIKKTSVFNRTNSGVSSRATKDADQTEEERITLEKSKLVLEQKAALYDRLHGGTAVLEDDSVNDKFLVNFQKKIVDDVMHRKKKRTIEDTKRKDTELKRKEKQNNLEENDIHTYGASSSQEEWIEYTDALGRSRMCQRKDLPAMKEQDNFINEGNEDNDPQPENFQEEAYLLSLKHSEKLRQKWESEEAVANTKKDIHYQDVLYDEARIHGVGYMKFSRDEVERKAQFDLLTEIKTEAKRGAAAKATLASKREKIMKARLEKVRQRKRLKLGLPMKESENDALKTPPGSDEETELVDSASPVPPITNEITSNEEQKTDKIREWDLEKFGKTSLMSQEEWVDKQRNDRDNEFAPPSLYNSVKSNSIDTYHINTTKEDKKTYPPFPSPSNNSNEYSQQSFSTASDSRTMPGTSDEETRSWKFAPPTSYEYYGPSKFSSKKTLSRTTMKSMENAINKGLSQLRNINEQNN